MKALPFEMKDDAVYFVPLGGCGNFGANMALYGHRDQWIMVDCGMGFADETMPGVDILLPDPAFAASLGSKLLGLVITHAHEDHIGSIEELWLRFKAPIYATPFSAERVKQSVGEKTWGREVPIHVVAAGGNLSLGPFSIDFIDVAHSIPEAQALAISVEKVGTVVHTGDWKLDPNPVVGKCTDEKRLRALGERGVLAVMGDSTNAMVPGHSGSEATVAASLTELFGEFKNRAIVISCFSTNVARIHSVYEAAKAFGRQVCLVGRSLWNIDDAARKSGYLKDIPPFMDDDEADFLPINQIIYICTGSQGEPRAALSRISSDDHPAMELRENDVVIFSSRAIPGNERAIDRIKNRLYAKGVHVVTDHDAPIHVSGHPYRDELKAMYSWLKPRYVVPVHGEQMQMEKHAQLAQECGAVKTHIPANGQVIEIAQDRLHVVGSVPHGVLALEGNRIVAVDHEAILTRKRMMWNGSAVITAVVNNKGILVSPPKITALGLLDESSPADQAIITVLEDEINTRVANSEKALRADDSALSELIRVTARRFFQEHFDRKPQTRVHLVRI